jgi:DNA-binding MarR family transcriptional regulator
MGESFAQDVARFDSDGITCIYSYFMSSTRRSAHRIGQVRHCACFNLRKATRAVTQYYDDVLGPSGLRITQFSLLGVIRLLGTASISQLADAAVMDRTTLARNLDLLAREKLVRIRPGADGRVREVSLTRTARVKLEAALPLWERAQGQLVERLGAERMERMLGDLSAAIVAARS